MNGFTAIYRVILGAIATKGRLAMLLALGGIAIVVGFAINTADTFDPVADAVGMVNGYGLAVLVPVVALVFASAALGDMVEDNTLVYLWLRPVGREVIALAAVAAAATITIPVVAVPLIIAALLASGGDGGTVIGTAFAVAVCALAYSGLFVALGLRVKRALAWGITYVLIWEGFVARAGTGVARFSIQTYGRSILSEASDVPLRLAEVDPVVAVVAPVLVACAGVALTTRYLHRRDVA
jgi:ABC-2 type transport system permease protein